MKFTVSIYRASWIACKRWFILLSTTRFVYIQSYIILFNITCSIIYKGYNRQIFYFDLLTGQCTMERTAKNAEDYKIPGNESGGFIRISISNAMLIPIPTAISLRTLYTSVIKNFFEKIKLLTKTYPCYSLGKDKLVICVSAWFLSKDCLSKYPLFLGSSLICRNQSPGSEMIKRFFWMGRLENSTDYIVAFVFCHLVACSEK